MVIGLVVFISLVASVYSDGCNSLTTDNGIVCVCNSTYCDTVPEVETSYGFYQIYSTSKTTPGFNSKTAEFDDATDDSVTAIIDVDPDTTYQTIIGFGGAFTDSAGININSLPSEAQDNLMNSYFSSSGVEYTLCRVPMGGTDFSTRGYSYDDVDGDVTLDEFSLADDDYDYKIPYIQKAQELTNNELKLFSSVWSAPKWMKSNNAWTGIGWLLEKYYQLWADYHIKFFDEYEKNNITFWGMTPQNEPIDGFFPPEFSKINAMGWIPYTMNKFIGENLGPTIRNSSHKDLKIILHDDNRILSFVVPMLLSDPETLSYADGVAYHWYTDFLIAPSSSEVETVKSYNEDLFVISSEACSGFLASSGLESPVELGSWSRGARYAEDIIQNLETGVNGWVDWNMVLNEDGGPTYVDNYVDSPIIVNATLEEFYKQPMFYTLGQFSKFLRPGSVRLETTITGTATNLRALAFLRPDNLTALIIYNSGSSNVTLQIADNNGKTALVDIESYSLNTILYS